MNTNKYAIHEAIARNATLSFHEPGDNGEDVVVRHTCSEIILAGIEYEKAIFAERGYSEDRERQSVNSMILDYIAVHWAQIDPEPEVESPQLHPISNPDPELAASMIYDWSLEPTKEEWLRERGIPIPGYESQPGGGHNPPLSDYSGSAFNDGDAMETKEAQSLHGEDVMSIPMTDEEMRKLEHEAAEYFHGNA